MDVSPQFDSQDLFSFVLADMAQAISQRDDESAAQRSLRYQAACRMILEFAPHDMPQLMLAGHCVILHEAMTANAGDTVRNPVNPARCRPRGNLVALNKAFNDNLARLERMRRSPAGNVAGESSPGVTEGEPPMPEPPVGPAAPPGETPDVRTLPSGMNRAARRLAAREQQRAARSRPMPPQQNVAPRLPRGDAMATTGSPAQSTPVPERGGGVYPSMQDVAACQANPEAMAALNAGDPARFAHALGIAAPSEAFLAAAGAAGSPFDPQAKGPWPSGTGSAGRKG